MKTAGWILVVLGLLAVLASLVMPRAISGTGVLNFGLMNDAFGWLLFGLFFAHGGLVLIAAARIVEAINPSSTERTAPMKASVGGAQIAFVIFVAGVALVVTFKALFG